MTINNKKITIAEQQDILEMKGLIIELFEKGFLCHEIGKRIAKHVIRNCPDYELKTKRVLFLYKEKQFPIRKVVIESGTSNVFVKRVLRTNGLYER